MKQDFGSGKRVSEPPKHVRSSAIDIDWMTVEEINEAIPPVYSKFLAEQIDLWR